MAHFGDGVEQALHYLFRLSGPEKSAGRRDEAAAPTRGSATPLRPSARDVADFYGLSSSTAAKLFTKLEKAGIVIAAEGREGGFQLARPMAEISVLDVADAIEGKKPLFRCKEVRANCVIFDDEPPRWATTGVCAIHGAMIEAERAMRKTLASTSLADIKQRAAKTIPAEFKDSGEDWFFRRRQKRRKSRNREIVGKTTSTEQP